MWTFPLLRIKALRVEKITLHDRTQLQLKGDNKQFISYEILHDKSWTYLPAFKANKKTRA